MRGRNVGRDAACDQQRLGGVARAVLLRLRVVDDRAAPCSRSALGVDVDVAVAVEVLDHRHLRLARDPLDQALAAARDDEVDRLRRRDQVADRGAVGRLHQLHRVGRQPGFGERRLHELPEREVRVDRLRAAAQDAGVAALDRERRRLDRHVRPALVDHREDAERHAHAADADAARPLAQLGDLADRIGHRRDLLAAVGDGLDRLRRRASGGRRAARRGRRPRAAPTSRAFAACSAAPLSRRRRASARSAAFFAAVGAAIMRALAARAAAPMWAMVACRSAEVMRSIVANRGRRARRCGGAGARQSRRRFASTSDANAATQSAPCRERRRRLTRRREPSRRASQREPADSLAGARRRSAPRTALPRARAPCRPCSTPARLRAGRRAAAQALATRLARPAARAQGRQRPRRARAGAACRSSRCRRRKASR